MENEKFIESIIDWSKFDANYEISQRTNGVTKELIELEVDLWQKQLELLPVLNYDKIFDEVNAWDLSLPENYKFETIAKVYARNSRYKVRMSYLVAQAKDWVETCETACKYIEDLSLGAYTGTANDKKANAKLIVKPFVHLRIQATRIENFLKEIHSAIIYNTDRINAILIQKQSEAKLNYKLIQDGESSIYSSDFSNNTEDYIDDNVEDNDELFLPVTKRNSHKTKK